MVPWFQKRLLHGPRLGVRPRGGGRPVLPVVRGGGGTCRVPFVYPTEIFPVAHRAFGNGFGVAGWAIGCGSSILANPVMFSQIQEKIFYVYRALNFAWIPLVYLFWPETAKRSLESIDWLFESPLPFTWKQEEYYRKAKEMYESEHFQAAEKIMSSRESDA